MAVAACDTGPQKETGMSRTDLPARPNMLYGRRPNRRRVARMGARARFLEEEETAVAHHQTRVSGIVFPDCRQ